MDTNGADDLDSRALRLEFGRRLRDARDRLDGVSQERLGEIAGLDRTYVGSVERGERNVSLVNIVKLARAVGVDPGDLLRDLGT